MMTKKPVLISITLILFRRPSLAWTKFEKYSCYVAWLNNFKTNMPSAILNDTYTYKKCYNAFVSFGHFRFPTVVAIVVAILPHLISTRLRAFTTKIYQLNIRA
jgi:hypothetical protein